jgi:hypothetical protein
MRRARATSILFAAIGGVVFASRAGGATSTSWLLPADDSWTDPLAWSTNPVYPNNGQPNPADLYNVTIGASGSPYTVTLNSDITISSLLVNSTDATLAQSAGTLHIVDGGASINAGVYALSGGTLNSDDVVSISDRFQWTGGTIGGFGLVNVSAPNGFFQLGTPTATRTLSTTLNSSGSIAFSGGSLVLSNGTLNNSGVMAIGAGASFTTGAGTSNMLRNTGYMTVAAGAGSVVLNVPLIDSGSIEVTSGTLAFGNGTFNEEAGASFLGAGTIQLSPSNNSVHNVNGTLTLAGNNILMSSGTINGAGPIDITGKLTYNGGTLNGNGLITIKPNASMDLGTLNVTRFIGRPINNLGAINFLSGAATLNSVLTNTSGGVMNYSSTNGLAFSVGSLGLLHNFGTINVNAGSFNPGTISITGLHAGTINVNVGTANIAGTFENGAYIGGAGTVNFAFGSGTAQLDGALTLAANNVNWNGGTFSGSGSINVTQGSMSWSSGTLTTSGAMNISNGAAVTTVFSARLVNSTINNAGTLTPGGMTLSGGTINNLANGYLNLGSNQLSSSGGLVRNNGTISLNFGSLSGSTFFNVPLVNSGTLAVATTGTTNFATLSFSGTPCTQLNGAVLRATGLGVIDLAFSSQSFLGNVSVLGTGFTQLNGGSISGSGDMNIGNSTSTGAFLLAGGTISGSGAVNVQGSGFFQTGGSGVLSRSVNNSGTFACSPVSGAGSLELLNATLTNSGSLVFGNTSSAGTITLNSGTINNLAGGMIVINHSGSPIGSLFGTSPSDVINSGTILSNPGTTSFVSIGAPLDNEGTINVQSGTLQFSTSNPTNQNNGAWLGGAGVIDLSGTQTINGNVTFAGNSLRIASGSMTNNGSINLTGSLLWSGGTISGPGVLTVAPGASLSIGGGSSSLQLLSNIANSGVASLSATLFTGSASNTLINNLSGGLLKLLAATPFSGPGVLRNSGTISLNPTVPGTTALSLQMIDNGTISVNNGSLLFGTATCTYNDGAIFTGTGYVDLGNGVAALNLLNGSLTLAGSNIAMSNGTITGSGNLEITGAFTWNGGTIGTGTSGFNGSYALIDVAPGATMTVGAVGNQHQLLRVLNNSGAINLNGSISLNPGTINNLAGGVMNITAGLPFGSNTGSLNLVTNAGTMNVNNSTGSCLFNQQMVDSGTINVAAGSLVFGVGMTVNGHATIAGPGVVNFFNATSTTFTLNGTLTLASALTRLSNATIAGDGDLELTNVASWGFGTIAGNGAFNVTSTGSLLVAALTPLPTLSRTLNNAGTSTFATGTLMLSNGTINNTATFNTAMPAAGSFTIAAGPGLLNRFVNSGTLDVHGGTMNIAVPFSNTGTLIVEGIGQANLTGGVTQVVGPTLTRGNWIVNDGAMLTLGGTPITNNAAHVVLSGPTSSFPEIAPLAVNTGTFEVLSGRTFATSAGYTNSGRTVVGTSSVLTINGDLTNTGTIDVSNLLVDNYLGPTPIATIAAQVATGFNGGSWNGIGINSTAAANDATHSTGLGYADASAIGVVGTGTVAGQSVDDTTVVVRYTLLGDANLDGVVNALDFNALASGFGSSGVWSQGDSNYDGVVNTADFTAMAANFGESVSAPAAPQIGVVVPEPLDMILLPAMGLFAVRNRRRRSARI